LVNSIMRADVEQEDFPKKAGILKVLTGVEVSDVEAINFDFTIQEFRGLLED